MIRFYYQLYYQLLTKVFNNFKIVSSTYYFIINEYYSKHIVPSKTKNSTK